MVTLSITGPEINWRYDNWEGEIPRVDEYIDFEAHGEGMTRAFGTVLRIHRYGSSPRNHATRHQSYQVHVIVMVNGRQPPAP